MNPNVAPHTTPTRGAAELLRLGGVGEFRDVVSRSFVPLIVSTQRAHHFHATVHGQMLEGIGLTEVAADPHVVERTRRLCDDRSTPPNYKVSLMLGGTGYLCQDGRDVVLGPGDLAIYDTTRPYTLAFDEGFRTIVAMFPKHLVSIDEQSVSRLTATALGRDDPMAELVATMLRQATGKLGQLGHSVGGRLARNMVDLVSILLREQMESEAPGANQPIERILAYITERLDDVELTPTRIAVDHFISVRYLHMLFQHEGTTVSAYIRRQRLQRCRADLADPELSGRSVTQIASRWGFSDAPHFSRLFKAEFGSTPSAFRALAQA